VKSYADILGDASPTVRSGQRVAEIVAALAPPVRSDDVDGDTPPAPATTALVKIEPKSEPIGPLMPFVPGLIGGAVGAVAWKKHRVLGFLAGHAVAASAIPIARGYGDERRRALFQLGIEGAGIGGALLLKKHANLNPALGWAVGILGGVAVTALIPGSPANEGVKQIRANAKKPGGSWLDSIYPKGTFPQFEKP
jgi:hypothetical protein